MTHAEQTIANHPRMMSIREIAKTGLLPEHTLRQMEKQKMLPCFYVGKKCVINYDRLIEQLQQNPELANTLAALIAGSKGSN